MTFRKRIFLITTALFGIMASLWAGSGGGLAQSNQTGVGPINLDYHQFEYIGNDLHIFDGVKMRSPGYDIDADSITIVLTSKQKRAKNSPPIDHAIADGKASTNKQVVVSFKQVSEGRNMKLSSDHAVITPDPSRPDGYRIEFIGHVIMILDAPVALAEPSKTTMDRTVVLLGKGPNYPRIEGENGHTVITPLQ